jgi:phage/plasmid primase-like uncharacterized protein
MIDGAVVDIARRVTIMGELERRGCAPKRRKARDIVGPCPVCGGDDRFVVSHKKAVWFCRGCGKGGDVIALAQHLDAVGFLRAVETLAGERPERGSDDQRAAQNIVGHERRRREQEEQDRRENEAKTKYAIETWSEGACIWDTPAQVYLLSRRCDGMFPPDRDAAFRFHKSCVFGGQRLPCLLTLLRNIATDDPQAVQRTALTADGKKIGRMMLGPKTGAAVKLWPHSCVTNRLVLGEGTESVLSAALHIHHRGAALAPAWAAIDAGNVRAFPVLPGVQELTILVDHDVPDERGRQEGQKAARDCSSRWTAAGRQVSRLTPNKPGDDFNDILTRS